MKKDKLEIKPGECEKSLDGKHCWHTRPLPMQDMFTQQICCWCGKEITIDVVLISHLMDKEHGPYFKTQLR